MTEKEIIADKNQEHLSDAMGEGVSNCCGARCYNPSGDPDSAICMDCKEHCSEEQEEEVPREFSKEQQKIISKLEQDDIQEDSTSMEEKLKALN
jgi:hypothetical protein